MICLWHPWFISASILYCLELSEADLTGLRVREQSGVAKSESRPPFEVVRWRLRDPDLISNTHDHSISPDEERHAPGPSSAQNERKTEPSLASTQRSKRARCNCAGRDGGRFHLDHSPLQDHLLNLVHFNVMRGIFSNKFAVMGLATYFYVGSSPDKPKIPYLNGAYPSRAVIVPTGDGIPASLYPTQLQITIEHSTWIDTIPFPKMRDNLITREALFDHAELAKDLIGDLVDFASLYGPQTRAKPHYVQESARLRGSDDEVATHRKGLIVWGDPHDPDSWEATPGFVRKWWWALEGCQNLVESTNRWRLSRGEKPLTVTLRRACYAMGATGLEDTASRHEPSG